MRTLEAIGLIVDELERAVSQHPHFPTDPIHAVAIMAEEAGEATQASLDFTYGGKHAEKLQKEIIQTGAMAVRNLINFHHFKANKSPQVEG